MAIEVANRQRLVTVAHQELAGLARNVILEIGAPLGICGTADLVIAIVRSKQMRRLNSLFRGKNVDTDVLSFPAGQEYNPGCDSYLGDVVICADVAFRQAAEAGLSIDREIAELVIHGVLHLAGFDHDVDNGEMNRLELKLRRRLLNSKAPATVVDARGRSRL